MLVSPRRYNFRFPYRFNRSFLSSPRLLTRITTPLRKSVRISTDPDFIPNQTCYYEPLSSTSRPKTSILRRSNSNIARCSQRLVDGSHIWKSEADGKVYVLDQFSIPRYYRLYNDVSFREIYNFSRLLQPNTQQTLPTFDDYSWDIRNCPVEQQLPTIRSVA